MSGARNSESGAGRGRRDGPRPAGRARGFTLYEVVVVMIVLLFVSGIVAPQLGNVLPSVRVSKTGQMFLAAASRARADAALTGRRHRIVFVKTVTPPAGAPLFRLEFEPDPLGNPALWRSIPGWTEEMPDGVVLESTEGAVADAATGLEAIEFSPDGSATAGTVVFSNDRGDRVEIQVNAADGVAKIVDPQAVKP